MSGFVTCRCNRVFIALGQERTCPECVVERERLTCDGCGTRLLREVADGLCGFCSPTWVVPPSPEEVAA